MGYRRQYKNEEMIQKNIYVPARLVRILQEKADAENQSFSKFVTNFLERYLKKEK